MSGVSSVILRLTDSRRTATLPVLSTVTAFAGGQYFPSLSPDQKRVAFVSQREDQEWGNVYVSNLDGGSSVRLTTDPGGDVFPGLLARWNADRLHPLESWSDDRRRQRR